MIKRNRPLSPHLSIYKPQLTSTLSILHRITGMGSVIMTFMVVLWLFSATMGQETYILFMTLATSLIGKIITYLGIFGFSYHFFNGIRHLLWDTGWGLELERVYQSGWSVVALSAGTSLLYTLL